MQCMKNIKISIITIAYNSGKTIERTIESVVNQDYNNKEYIIIDGKSTDNTMDIVSKYSDRIDFVLSEKDKGISDAFNKGIENSTGDLIVCINSDDYMMPHALEYVAEHYEEGIDLFCGNLILWNQDTDYKCRIEPSLKFPVPPFFCKPAHQGVFATKKIYKSLGGYDENIKYAMDLDFLIRATNVNAKFKHLDFDIAVFKLGGATSESIFKKGKEYIYIVRKNGGNWLQAFGFYAFLVITQTTKKILQLSGLDIVRRLRYKKMT